MHYIAKIIKRVVNGWAFFVCLLIVALPVFANEGAPPVSGAPALDQAATVAPSTVSVAGPAAKIAPEKMLSKEKTEESFRDPTAKFLSGEGAIVLPLPEPAVTKIENKPRETRIARQPQPHRGAISTTTVDSDGTMITEERGPNGIPITKSFFHKEGTFEVAYFDRRGNAALDLIIRARGNWTILRGRGFEHRIVASGGPGDPIPYHMIAKEIRRRNKVDR